MKLKKKIIIFGASLLCISAVSGTIYYKRVQADQLNSSFKSYIQHGKYKEAEGIYNKLSQDKIIGLIFNQDSSTKKIVEDKFEGLKKDYEVNKIEFHELKNEIGNISKFNCLDKAKVNEEIEKDEKIEAARQSYKNAELLYADKKYEEAADAVNKLSAVDKVTNEKAKTLKVKINTEYLSLVNSQVDELVKDEKFQDALKLLDEKKNIYAEGELDGRVKGINDLIAKKAEEEKKRKEEEERKRKEEEQRRLEEEQRRKEAYTASLLSGYVPNPDKENAVKGVSSSTSFLIWVSLSQQTTYIFTGDSGNWKLIRSYQCASGKAGDETPKGTFTVTGRGSWFYNSAYAEGARYWTQFYGNYLFHSYPMDSKGNILDSSLGAPASHGCVRLDTANAEWIYENIPNETKVIIN